jgi:putative membrane protein
MILESILAFVHLSAIFTLIVFLTSEAALCRTQWLNPAVVERLVTVDRIYLVALLAVLASGLLRVYLGIKGSAWYWGNWLLHVKLAMFVVAAALAIRPTKAFRRWRGALRASGALPPADEVTRVRRQVMVQAHIVPLIPLAAVFLARGFGGR